MLRHVCYWQTSECWALSRHALPPSLSTFPSVLMTTDSESRPPVLHRDPTHAVWEEARDNLKKMQTHRSRLSQLSATVCVCTVCTFVCHCRSIAQLSISYWWFTRHKNCLSVCVQVCFPAVLMCWFFFFRSGSGVTQFVQHQSLKI